MRENSRPLQFDAVVKAPFGAVGIAVQGQQLATELLFGEYHSQRSVHPLVAQVAGQIEAYFAQKNYRFDLSLVLSGTDYQKRVWKAISAIPIGYVATYQDIAHQLDSGPRAVANACGANHLPLIVPCHRVVAKSGLGGFMQGNPNGLAIKTCLLQHEGVRL